MILSISEAIERVFSANYVIMMDGNIILSLKGAFVHVHSNPENLERMQLVHKYYHRYYTGLSIYLQNNTC